MTPTLSEAMPLTLIVVLDAAKVPPEVGEVMLITGADVSAGGGSVIVPEPPEDEMELPSAVEATTPET